jgi:tetratricopeptide (TPR) repeat protein
LRREPAAAGLAITTAAREVGPRTRRPDERAHGTWYLLAGVAERAGQLESAEALFRQALSAADARQQFSISVAIIRVLRAGRRHEDLVQFCTAALHRQPAMKVVFHNHLASALVRLDRIEEAVKHADDAVAAAEAGDRLAAVLNRVGILAYAEQFRRAEDECLTLLHDTKQPGGVQQIRHSLANVYATARHYDQAEEQLRLLIELDPADAKAHNDLGYELADRGRQLDEAERLVRRALELDRAQKSDSLDDEGDRGAYLDSLGWVLFRKGRFAEARAVLEQAAATADAAADPVVWDHLGDACARLDKPADAADAWERARDLYRTEKRSVTDPHGSEVERKLKRVGARP